MPKVSVIIPNYNHARFLEQRIESVLTQTFQDFEVILLDDASTDSSKDIFAKYANHPKISHVVFNEINSGSPFKQWFKGFSFAEGEYIWIAESDDYAEPTVLEKLVQKLDSYNSVGLAYCQSWQVDENGTAISTLDWWTDDLDINRWKNDYIESGLEICADYLSIKNVIPNASAVLFRHCFISELKSDIEGFKLCGDWLFWIQILLRSDLSFVAEPLNYFRHHKNTARKLTKLKNEIFEQVNILEHLSRSVKISDQVVCKRVFDLTNLYFSCYYTEPFDFKDFLRFYKAIVVVNHKYAHYKKFYINIFNNIFSLMRFKIGVRAKISNLFKVVQKK